MIYKNTVDTLKENKPKSNPSDVSDMTVADSNDTWDLGNESEFDSEVSDFLYEALCNEHPMSTEVDLEALAAV